jgi:hypothetical protein
MLATSVDDRTYIPPKAFQYKLIIKTTLDETFPDIPTYHYIPSLIEHESCISLTSKKCWDPTSRLKTSREEGAGVGQLTRTYNPDGSIRFDTLADVRRAHMAELKDLSWSNVYQRPDLQIKTMIIMLRTDYKKLYAIPDVIERLKMTDSSYNAGYDSVNKKRRMCSLTKGCDPDVWDNNVGKQCLGNNTPIYGKRSACDINKHHVSDVFDSNLPKYKRFYNFTTP